ncbi:MAG TPA: nicotinate-nucleotide adenylyltransferase [Candidatus Eisenbacteria bacterium]
MSRRIGLFGGTFDPPHVGHLAIAEWARETLRLERVLFVPAGFPPHKRRARLSSVEHRLAMTRLAVRDNAAFTVSTLEARRDGPSFTVDTLRAVRHRDPRARLYLLMGADSLADFPGWRDPVAILGCATLAVAVRPGSAARAAAGAVRRLAPGARIAWLANPGLDLSSSAIRARAGSGRSVRYLVPDAVARYVARHRLYRRGG